MRATTHSGRAGKNGAYNPRHNDRNFDIGNAEHIDPERVKNNHYWNWTGNLQMSFEDAEAAFYEKHCRAHLDAQNNRYRAQRHAERVRSIDEYRQARQTCPEEVILMVGNRDEHAGPETLWQICKEFKDWQEKTFPGLRVLDMALHADEEGAPHVHARQVWLYSNKDGMQAVGQDKCLQAAGIPLPHPDKPRSRYNNRKQTASRMMREQFFSICREHGFGSMLETTPREASRSGRELEDYKANEAQKRAQSAEARARAAEERTQQAEASLKRVKRAKGQAQERTQRAQEQAEQQQAENNALKVIEGEIRSKMEREQRTARQLSEMNQKARQELKKVKEQLEVYKTYLSKAEERELQEMFERKQDDFELE